jgi:hypothetical protein
LELNKTGLFENTGTGVSFSKVAMQASNISLLDRLSYTPSPKR